MAIICYALRRVESDSVFKSVERRGGGCTTHFCIEFCLATQRGSAQKHLSPPSHSCALKYICDLKHFCSSFRKRSRPRRWHSWRGMFGIRCMRCQIGWRPCWPLQRPSPPYWMPSLPSCSMGSPRLKPYLVSSAPLSPSLPASITRCLPFLWFAEGL